jgi:hypothetical protein
MGWPARRSGTRAAMLVTVAVLAAVASLIAVLTPAASARSSDHGASFAVRCDYVLEPDRRLPDDPIVHPGMPGIAHGHDFFGNLTTNADSTYDSLLGQETTCTRPEDGRLLAPDGVLGRRGSQLQPRRLLLPRGRQGSQKGEAVPSRIEDHRRQ